MKFARLVTVLAVLALAWPVTAQPLIEKQEGGDKLVVHSGGIIDIESGGYFDIAGVRVTSSAAALNGVLASGGTTASTFVIDSDYTGAKISFDTNSATGNFTAKVVPSNLSGNIVLALPTSSGTLALTSDTAINLDLGGTAAAGSLDIFSGAGAGRKLTFTCADTGADSRSMSITNASLAASRAYVIPDAGGAGQFVMTTANNSLLVNANSGDRTMSLAGNVTLAGALTTGAALTFSGANAVQFTTSGAYTYTLPAASGTLALTTGAETGTAAQYFTVDNDNATGKFKLSNTQGGGDYTITLATPSTTGDRVITLPDLTTTLAGLAGTQTFTGDKTFTGTVDLRGNVTAAAANPSFDLSGSSGAMGTPTGTLTLNGSVTSASGAKAFNLGNFTGAFTTPSGANNISGDLTTAAAKAVSLGTAAGGPTSGQLDIFSATGSKGELRIKQPNDNNNKITTVQANNPAGDAVITLPSATATLATLALQETLDAKTLTAAGNITQTGAVKVTTGTSGLETLSADSSLIVSSTASGNAAFDVTLTNATHLQASTYKIPDSGAATAQVVVTTGDNSVKINANAANRTVSLAGNVTLAGALTTVGANALQLTTGGATTVTLPVTGTLATTGGTETLSGKSIDGDDNTLTDIGPGVAKAITTDTVPGIPVVIQFDTTTATETVSYTIPAGKTFRVLDVVVYKSSEAGSADDTVQVFNGTDAITDAISLNISDNVRAVPTTIDDAKQAVSAGALLKVVATKGGGDGGAACRITVIGAWQ